MTCGRSVLLLLVLALACAATAAAPKVHMKIVARPKIGGEDELVVEPADESVEAGPVLRRQPMPPQGTRCTITLRFVELSIRWSTQAPSLTVYRRSRALRITP